MEARCQCGSVSFKTPLDKPLALYICHCAECRRQTSSAFGTSAIFPRFPLPQAELLSCYTRPTHTGHSLYCYFCRNCGTRLIHTTPGKNVVSVKGGCLEGLDWSRAIHIWTKSAMVPIPEGSESFSEEPSESEYCTSQESLDQPPDAPGMLVGNGGWPTRENIGESASDTSYVKGACELSGKLGGT
ncbi:Mss4-like protein [Rostrohypoxylon terebratum]|nr:Mss4-like protein [Rostrohypoxylon terebratum]